MPNLYHIDLAGNKRVPIVETDTARVSRSRYAMETEQQWQKLSHRMDFQDLQRAYDEPSLVTIPKDFAVSDGNERDHALSCLNILQLLQADVAVQQRAQVAAEKSLFESAVGLKALADAAKTAHGSNTAPTQKPESTPDQKRRTIITPATTSTNNASNGTNAPGPLATSPQSDRRHLSRKRQNSKPQPQPPIERVAGPPDMRWSQYGGQLYAHNPQSNPPLSTPNPPSEGKNVYPPYPESGASAPSWNPAYASSQQLPQPFKLSHSPTGAPEHSTSENRKQEDRTGPSSRSEQMLPAFPSSMGPPIYQPKYISDSNLLRPPSAAGSPITPQPQQPRASAGSNDWPGFSNNAAANNGRAASFDAKIAQTSSFPQLAPSALFNRESSKATDAASPKSVAESANRTSPKFEAHHPPAFPSSAQPAPFLQPRWDQSASFQHPSSSYLSFHSSTPQQHVQRDLGGSAGYPSVSAPPLPANHILPENRRGSTPSSQNSVGMAFSPSFRTTAPPYEQRRSRQSPPSASSGFQLPGFPPPATYSSPSDVRSGPASLPPLVPSRTQMQHHPGQQGHQRILPASLDPSRANSADSRNIYAGRTATVPAAYSPSSASGATYQQPGSSEGVDALGRQTSLSSLAPAESRSTPITVAPASAPTPSGRGGSSHRQPGQLQWKHYANIQPAPSPTSNQLPPPTLGRIHEPRAPTPPRKTVKDDHGGKKSTDKSKDKGKDREREIRWRQQFFGWTR